MQIEYEMLHRYAPIKYKSDHGNTQCSNADEVTITQKPEIVATHKRSEVDGILVDYQREIGLQCSKPIIAHKKG
jgi:hypothetical protein